MTIDPGTGLTVLGTALGSKDLVVKLLGPTADYLGGGVRDWTERSVKNIGRVFEIARKKLGDKIDTHGAVPPKVLKGIIGEAPFCDDELAAEYFGGVLASSRSGVGRDDRGAAFVALIGRLSTYQIRSHFFFYSLIRMIYEGSTENIGVQEGRLRLKTFIPLSSYSTAMEFGEGESLPVLVSHVMFGLAREALIELSFSFGMTEHVRSEYGSATVPGLVFTPSALGVELYHWAHGKGDVGLLGILNPEVKLESDAKITTSPGICSVNFPERGFPKPTLGGEPKVESPV